MGSKIVREFIAAQTARKLLVQRRNHLNETRKELKRLIKDFKPFYKKSKTLYKLVNKIDFVDRKIERNLGGGINARLILQQVQEIPDWPNIIKEKFEEVRVIVEKEYVDSLETFPEEYSHHIDIILNIITIFAKNERVSKPVKTYLEHHALNKRFNKYINYMSPDALRLGTVLKLNMDNFEKTDPPLLKSGREHEFRYATTHLKTYFEQLLSLIGVMLKLTNISWHIAKKSEREVDQQQGNNLIFEAVQHVVKPLSTFLRIKRIYVSCREDFNKPHAQLPNSNMKRVLVIVKFDSNLKYHISYNANKKKYAIECDHIIKYVKNLKKFFDKLHEQLIDKSDHELNNMFKFIVRDFLK